MRSLLITLMIFSALNFCAPIAGAQKLATNQSINEDFLSGLKFRAIGPAFMSGRISDISIDPKDKNTWYVAVGSGGVWKTVNGGTTFTPIFDDQGSYSIGCITIDPVDSNVVWVGSGENVSGRHVGYGDGIYRSGDGGQTWQNMGLKKSEHIDKILIDPRDTNVIYVAAEGPLWSSGGERGVFKSNDGGKTWTSSLLVDADTGATDLIMHPENSKILYAATHQRRRHVAALINGGPGSAIYKSVDGGIRWTKLSKGLPAEDMGQIALAISPQRPEVVYASVETSIRTITFYRSEDGGSNWQKGASYVTPGTGPHYYQELFASPHQFDRIYSMEINILVSNDGGKNWAKIPENAKHGDNHALAFDPLDPEYLLSGSDGGLYETRDGGQNWRFMSNLPITQFYRIALDNDLPFYNIVGGTQDNCTQLGPSQTIRREGGLNTDWVVTMGGDGYSCQIDPQDANTIYCEAQVGEMVRYNKKTGEAVGIKPFIAPGEDVPRWNWDSPLIISPFDHKRLYFASQRLYRSDDRGDSWRPVSGDLSRGLNRLAEKYMGRSWSVNAVWDNDAMSYYGNVTTVSESPLQEGLIYCGTDDGLIQVSADGGKNWKRYERFPEIPAGSFVNEIMASKHERDVVYALFDNHQRGDFKPYILKSSNRGESWTSLAQTLPDRHILWSIEQDHLSPQLLFLGSEFGVFYSSDGGLKWGKMTTGGLPTIAIRDIKIHARENDLVCASFGRGIFILDDYSPMRALSEKQIPTDFTLYPVRDGRLYHSPSPLGGGEKGTQGQTFYTAANAPFGVTFSYFLKESLKSKKEQRRETEKKIEQSKGDVPFPGWEYLRQEKRELEPSLEFVIEDDEGTVIRRLSVPAKKGLHRVTWDMRSASHEPVRPKPSSSPFSYGDYGENRGQLVLPGRYFTTVYRTVAGVRTAVSTKTGFSCQLLEDLKLTPDEFSLLKSFQKRVIRLNLETSAMSEVIERILADLEILQLSLMRALKDDPSLQADLLGLREKVLDLSDELQGDSTRSNWAEPRQAGLYGQFWMIASRGGANWSAVSPTQVEQLNKIAADLRVFGEKLLPVVQTEFPKLIKKAKALGMPWVPGFGLYDLP